MPEGKRNGKSADVRASVSAKQKKLGFTEMEQAGCSLSISDAMDHLRLAGDHKNAC